MTAKYVKPEKPTEPPNVVITDNPEPSKQPIQHIELSPEQIETMRQQAFVDAIEQLSVKHSYRLVPVVVTVPMMDNTFVLRAQINVVKR